MHATVSTHPGRPPAPGTARLLPPRSPASQAAELDAMPAATRFLDTTWYPVFQLPFRP